LLVIPISGFSSLFGSDFYLKSMEICYKAGSTCAFISGAGIFKWNEADSYTTVIVNGTDRTSTTRECFSVTSATPRVLLDNSAYVQVHLFYNDATNPTRTPGGTILPQLPKAAEAAT
jgi:hypothetical protein